MAQLPRQNPVELFSTSKSILNDMSIVTNPDVHAIVIDEVFANRVTLNVRAWKVRSETRVSTRSGMVFETKHKFSCSTFDSISSNYNVGFDLSTVRQSDRRL